MYWIMGTDFCLYFSGFAPIVILLSFCLKEELHTTNPELQSAALIVSSFCFYNLVIFSILQFSLFWIPCPPIFFVFAFIAPSVMPSIFFLLDVVASVHYLFAWQLGSGQIVARIPLFRVKLGLRACPTLVSYPMNYFVSCNPMNDALSSPHYCNLISS